MAEDDKLQTLKYFITENAKKYGKHTINYGITKREKVSTGSIYFDYLLDGGVERGSILGFWGLPRSGKTLMALRIIAEAQKRGESCVWFRIEKGTNREHAENVGVDMSKLLVVEQMETGEQWCDIIVDAVNKFDTIVVDSISTIIPTRVLQESAEKKTIGAQASLLTDLINKINHYNTKSNVILISQARDDINAMGYTKYKYSGGWSFKHLTNYIVEFKLKGYFNADQGEVKDIKKENKDEITGINMLLYVEKNQRGASYRAGEMYYSFKNCRVDEEGEIITVAEKLGVIEDAGGWLKLDTEFVAKFGMDKDVVVIKEACRVKELKQLMRDNSKAKDYFIKKIRKTYEKT